MAILRSTQVQGKLEVINNDLYVTGSGSLIHGNLAGTASVAEGLDPTKDIVIGSTAATHSLTVNGDLKVTGDVVYTGTENLRVKDKNIDLNVDDKGNAASTRAGANGAGITVRATSATGQKEDVTLVYDSTKNAWTSNVPFDVTVGGTVDSAKTAETASKVAHTLKNGTGISTFTFDGSAEATVSVDDTHIQGVKVNAASNADNATTADTASKTVGKLKPAGDVKFTGADGQAVTEFDGSKNVTVKVDLTGVSGSVAAVTEKVTTLEAKVDANKSATDTALQTLEGKIDNKVGSVKPGSAINVTGTTTAPTVSVKLAETQGNVQLDVTNGLKANLSADAALSTTSENPVQNKVITAKVNSLETSLGSKANASDIPTRVSQLENDSTYQTKANLDTALEGYATTESVTTEVGKKQDKLVSGTNIKTINDQSLLGEGNISIESTSITVDNALSDTSENPVQNKVVTAELNNKPSYVTKGSKHFLNVEGELNASGGIYSRGVISAGTSRGTLDLNTRSKYTDNKVDIFRWTGYGGGDTFVLTSDANAGTKSLSLGDGSSIVPIQYIPDTKGTKPGKLVHNCNVVLKGDPGKGNQPEFQILDYASVSLGSTTPDYVSIKCDGGWFKINWNDGEGRITELVAISPDEFNVFGENIPLRSDYDSLNTRVTALEASLGDIDTALNTILGNS